ncbi:MAG TPA: cation-efflux pump, partial [Candidimonas sp.]|nr:cation-efflux pump [Candidimonas sp.]
MSLFATEVDEHDPQNEPDRLAAGRRSTWVSVVLNIALSAVQAVAGIWAGSQALVAD